MATDVDENHTCFGSEWISPKAFVSLRPQRLSATSGSCPDLLGSSIFLIFRVSKVHVRIRDVSPVGIVHQPREVLSVLIFWF